MLKEETLGLCFRGGRRKQKQPRAQKGERRDFIARKNSPDGGRIERRRTDLHPILPLVSPEA